MTLRVSTGLKFPLMEVLAERFYDAMFRLYSGEPPASADLAPTGTYLGYITRDGLTPGPGHGITLVTSQNGYVTAMPGETWKLIGVGTGNAGYARLSSYSDAPVDSPTTPRIDFGVNDTDNNGILLPSVAIIPGLSRDVTGFFYTIPG
jgi:hypothetical protein